MLLRFYNGESFWFGPDAAISDNIIYIYIYHAVLCCFVLFLLFICLLCFKGFKFGKCFLLV